MDINDAWKDTCRVLLEDEIGELEHYRDYLKKYIEPVYRKTSSLSGRPVFVSGEEYDPGARFLGHGEEAEYRQKTDDIKLDINQIKDLDSIAAALQEKFVYSGSVVLGTSDDVEGSHRVTSSFHVLESHDITDSKYAAFCFSMRKNENVFGCSYTSEAKFGIKGCQFYRSSRCMEVVMAMHCSDCYFSANLEDCSDCMFSFNQKSRRLLIGNLELPREKYLSLKAGLVGQIRTELERKKSIQSIQQILGARAGAEAGGVARPRTEPDRPVPKFKRGLELAFHDTTAVLLGRGLQNLQSYAPWLAANVRLPIQACSALSGKPIFIAPLLAYSSWSGRAVSLEEAQTLSKEHLEEAETGRLSVSNSGHMLDRLAYSTSELVQGKNSDMEACTNYFDSRNCALGFGYFLTKDSACCFFSREGENLFGCDTVFYSKFCLKCHHSTYLVRCLEVSESFSCSDCLFCHNIENCQECMFCFNVKAKRYAIGNVEYKKEDYLRIKKLVLAEIGAKLEKDKKLDLSIYNMGGQ